MSWVQVLSTTDFFRIKGETIVQEVISFHIHQSIENNFLVLPLTQLAAFSTKTYKKQPKTRYFHLETG